VSSIGLIIAALMSFANVFMEVARKRALYQRTLLPTTFWCHVFDFVVFAVAFTVRVAAGSDVVIQDGGMLFGIAGLHLTPVTTYIIYLVLDLLLLASANLLFFMALKLSPLSVCVPLLAFTSVLLIPTGLVVLGELPPAVKLLGVILIVFGAFIMHRKQAPGGWLAPFKALATERGSRYMLLVALLLAVTSPLDKKLVLMSDIYTQSLLYGFGMCLFFCALSFARREKFMPSVRGNLLWIGLAGSLDAGSLLLQFASYRYIDVVISVSIKRAGIVLSVLLGWLFFKERGILDRAIAASVMFVGVLILYIPLSTPATILLSSATLVSTGVALFVTRTKEAQQACTVRS